MAGGLALIDQLLESDLGKSKIAKQGLEDMRLLLRLVFILFQAIGIFNKNDNIHKSEAQEII